MFQYFLLLFNAWLISTVEISNEELFEVKNRSPLILTPDQGFYQFPIKARITTDQKQEFYYNKKKDVLFFCPKENEASGKNRDREEDVTRAQNPDELKYLNCLYEKQFKKGEEKMCKGEVKPVIVEKKDSNGRAVPCGKTGYFYKVAYKVCVNKTAIKKVYNKIKMTKLPEDTAKELSTIKNKKVPPYSHCRLFGVAGKEIDPISVYHPLTYEVCYDHSQNRVLFTKHRILSPYILRNLILDDERALHEFPQTYSTETYGIENLKNLENIAKAYKQQENSEDEQQLQMLVPTDDFALGHWMKTTFHIINYGLLHKSRVAVWDAINSYLRERLSLTFEKIGELRIFTGTSDEQSVGKSKKKLYLGNDQESGITIPKVWWKLLYVTISKRGIVIIMHNVDLTKKICDKEKTACDVAKWKTDELEEEDFEYVYCCSLSSASKSISVLHHLQINLDHDVLKID